MSASDSLDEFRFLAATFAPPSEALTHLLREDAEVPGGGAWVFGFDTEERLLSALTEEHTRLFVTASPRLAAPPYAAAYLAAERPESLLDQIVHRLARMGLTPRSGQCIRADELRLLLDASGQISDAGRRQAFVSDFLAPWFPAYRKRLCGDARLPLYPGLVAAADELIREESRGHFAS